MIPALAISYVISALFFEAQWQGVEALSSLNIMVARIATASFMAYVLEVMMAMWNSESHINAENRC